MSEPNPDGLDIPDFLRVTKADIEASKERAKSVPPPLDPVMEEQRKRREVVLEARKQKRKAALAAFQAKHEGQRWDRKLRQWVRNDT